MSKITLPNGYYAVKEDWYLFLYDSTNHLLATVYTLIPISNKFQIMSERVCSLGGNMPGPVSDSYDPEFSTGARATAVREAIMTQRDRFTKVLGDRLLPIVDIANDEFECTLPPGASRRFTFTEREMRIIRFALNRAIDSARATILLSSESVPDDLCDSLIERAISGLKNPSE